MKVLPICAYRSKFITKVLIVIVILWVFYSECVTYWTLPLTWIEVPNCQAPHCKRLLLVSDPQIIGPEWPFFFMDLLSIWDSDRYIKRTFLLAESHLKPDIIIFLGDLMDQGHIATEYQFQLYINRLKNIFELPSSSKNVKLIYLPGDNDIGGVDDILVPQNVKRFNNVFNQTEDCFVINDIEFCKVNLMTATLQQSHIKDDKILKVVLSHVPLIPKESFFLKEVIKKIRPRLVFSGHEHSSAHFTVDETDIWSHKHGNILPTDVHLKMYNLREGIIHEIIVPTCSYRMGVSNMGYGAAFLDTEKQVVYYNVLWLPRRFSQLFFYVIITVPFGLVILFWTLINIRTFRRQKRHASLFHE